MKHEVTILGNLFGGTGGNWAGMVYAAHGCAPSILTMSGGGRQPHVVIKEVRNDLCKKHSGAPG